MTKHLEMREVGRNARYLREILRVPTNVPDESELWHTFNEDINA
jgi:hypothetical protein